MSDMMVTKDVVTSLTSALQSLGEEEFSFREVGKYVQLALGQDTMKQVQYKWKKVGSKTLL